MKIFGCRIEWWRGLLFGLLLALVPTWIFFNQKIQRAMAVHSFLSSKTPRDELFDQAAKGSDDPGAFLQRCWATGKVTHRQFVAAFLKDQVTTNSTWHHQAERLMFACATDADSSVRELGLAALEAHHSSRLFAAALAQLDDLDPLVRLLGLEYLRKCDTKKAVPIFIRLLDDTDPRIVAAAEVNLMRSSGEDFGIRARLAIPPDGSRPGSLDPAHAETIRLGVERRKEWWRVHQKEYAENLSSWPHFAQTEFAEPARPSALDFTLQDINGKSLSLSAFRGKVVLLNFWATWCTACLEEIPDLVALQSKMGNQVAIIGVALDGVPDEDGDSPGEAGEKSPKAGTSLKIVRSKVERAVKSRQINYTVLLDPKGSVGGQYRGGELPTTVIFDAEGRVRRRFVGERNLAVFEAMLAEASKPITAAGTHLLVNGD